MFTLLLTWCSAIYSDTINIYTAVPWTCLLCLIGVINESYLFVCTTQRSVFWHEIPDLISPVSSVFSIFFLDLVKLISQ